MYIANKNLCVCVCVVGRDVLMEAVIQGNQNHNTCTIDLRSQANH